LSNLRVLSAGVTYPFLRSSYIAFFYHRYRQINASDSVDNLSIDLSLNGQSRELGQALDIELSLWESSHWYAELALGAFFAGDAVDTPHPMVNYALLEISHQF
ncbi:MAG: alginate export family protein, partial [Pseudomonadota bacterium]